MGSPDPKMFAQPGTVGASSNYDIGNPAVMPTPISATPSTVPTITAPNATGPQPTPKPPWQRFPRGFGGGPGYKRYGDDWGGLDDPQGGFRSPIGSGYTPPAKPAPTGPDVQPARLPNPLKGIAN